MTTPVVAPVTGWRRTWDWIVLGLLVLALVVLGGGVVVGVAFAAYHLLLEADVEQLQAATVAVGTTSLLVVGSLAQTWRAHRRQARRRAAATAWAAEHGWALPEIGRITLSRRVGNRRVASRTLGMGRAREHVVTISLPDVVMPTLALSRESAAPDRATLLGEDILLEHVDFNRRWRVRATNRSFAHAVLHPRLMERLMGADLDDVSILVDAGQVSVHAPGQMDLDRVEPMTALAVEILDAIPRSLLQDHAAPSGQTRRERLALMAEKNR